MNDTSRQQIWVMRHAETAWSLSGQHTGLTDIPLTAKGEKAAAELNPCFWSGIMVHMKA